MTSRWESRRLAIRSNAKETVALLVAVSLILGALLARTPPPEYFLTDPDGGFFIAGGWQLLTAGKSAQLDFLSSYGPLSFQLRAAAFALLGPRILAETVLVTIGYFVAYMFLFVLARENSRSRLLGLLILLAALAALPRYYKFPVVLFPLLTLAATSTYLRRPHPSRAAWLGVSVGLTALFRHDFGFCSAICAAVAVAWPRRPLRACLWPDAVTLVAAASVPFAFWVGIAGRFVDLGQVVRDLVQVTATQGSGLSLPHPLRTWSAPSESLLFLTFYLAPLVLGWRLWCRWPTLSRADAGNQLCIALLTTLVLGQSMHRADLGHLQQAIAPAWIALASAWPDGRSRESGVSWGRATAILWLGGLLVFVGTRAGWYNLAEPAEIVARWRAVSADRVAMMEATLAAHPEPGPTHLPAFIAERTAPHDSVVVFPFQPQIPFFAGRLFAGDTFLVAPGYFTSVAFQSRMIAGLRRDRPAIVLWDLEYQFDNQPSRATSKTHSEVLSYVQSSMTLTGSVGPYAVFTRTSEQAHR